MKKFNELIAVRATLVFGSMWMTYLFFLYGFIPVMFPHEMNTLLYWSNTIQLWSLPLLMVGQNVMSRVSERRAQETHDAVMDELKELKQLHAELHEKHTGLIEIVTRHIGGEETDSQRTYSVEDATRDSYHTGSR